MILKASKRGGANQMAIHLLNADQNEHVDVHEISGFMSDNIIGALNEIHAISKGTQCNKFMFSLSLSPPEEEKVPVSVFEGALKKIEKQLGLEGQPRVVVFHEKEGRRHAHCVWSRIDAAEMKAIDQDFFKNKLNTIGKSLYIEHGWKMPEGFRDKNRGNPLNFSRLEWQQALRVGRKPQDIKRELQECWAVSDSKKSFENTLRESGYFLGRGDKRGFVAVDAYGEVYSLTKQIGKKKRELEARLGNPQGLPSVAETKDKIDNQLTPLFARYNDELKVNHQKHMQPLLTEKQTLTNAHRELRKQLKTFQRDSWQEEENKRAVRIRSGFNGLFDKINGRYWKTRKRNESETWKCHVHDQKQREEIINKQLIERQNLQAKINLLLEKQELERKSLIKDLSHLNAIEQIKEKSTPKKEQFKEQQSTTSSGANNISNAYHNANNGKEFKQSLEDMGYKIAIAQYDQFVYVKDNGSIQSLVKNIEAVKYKDIAAKLADIDKDKLLMADDLRAEIVDNKILEFNGEMSRFWLSTNNGVEFARTLNKHGFTLATNDKGNYVYVTEKGSIRSFPKNLDGGKGVYESEITKRFSDLEGHEFIKIRHANNVQRQIQQERYGAYERKIRERIEESRETWDIDRLEKEQRQATKALQSNGGFWGRAARQQNATENLNAANLNLEAARTRLAADIKAINKHRPQKVINEELQKQGFIVEKTSNSNRAQDSHRQEREYNHSNKQDHQNLNDFDGRDIDMEQDM